MDKQMNQSINEAISQFICFSPT